MLTCFPFSRPDPLRLSRKPGDQDLAGMNSPSPVGCCGALRSEPAILAQRSDAPEQVLDDAERWSWRVP